MISKHTYADKARIARDVKAIIVQKADPSTGHFCDDMPLLLYGIDSQVFWAIVEECERKYHTYLQVGTLPKGPVLSPMSSARDVQLVVIENVFGGR